MKTVVLALFVSSAFAWGQTRPNIVFILADDLDFNSIADNLGRTIDGTVFMPRLKALADQGLTFTNTFVTFALCCPSRASILRGQYPQNTGILGNAPPLGGFQGLYQKGLESSTIGTWLQAAGYQTALIGRYLNEYPNTAGPVYVPPGWDEWRVKARSPSIQMAYLEYDRVENGVSVYYPPAPDNYLTDTETADVARFIQNSDHRPFFIFLAPFAPHGPQTPAPRHANLFPSAQIPQPPSFNEPDVSDKPAWIQALPVISPQLIQNMDNHYGNRLRSMMAVDDMIGRVVDELQAKGKLDNSYIFFTSDNGLHMGQHRMTAQKGSAYEEDIRVPLIVAGPGVPPGTRSHVVLNTDFAPTFAELAGATVPDFVDGRSFQSLLTNQPPLPEDWQSSFLIQYAEGADPSFSAPSYYALRILTPQENILYNELASGGEGNLGNEFYDLSTDPFQLDNRYSSLDPQRRDAYSQLLNDLKTSRPAPPTGLTATATSDTQINFAWTDASSNETGFKIERSTDDVTFTEIATLGANAVTHSDAGLTAGTLYYYRVRAYNIAGHSAYSNTLSVIASVSLPAPPAGLTAIAVSETQIDLTWTDVSNNETGFKVERSTDNVTFTEIAAPGADAATYSEIGLTAGTLYYYRVRAYNPAGNSTYSNTANATPMSLPAPPTGLTATATSDTRIHLAWTDASHNETGFRIERSTDNVTFTEIGTAGHNAGTYSNTGLSAGTLYYYRVRTYNAVGNSTYSNTANATTMSLPAPPTGLTATALSATQINLAWTDASNDETGFKIERSIDNVTFVQLPLKEANATTHTSGGLVSGTLYYYRVRAYNTAGNSAYSNTASATTLVLPAPPTGLTATAISDTQINLAWTDTSNDETGFRIERSTDNVTFVQLPLKGANATTHTSAGLVPATLYYYRVRAYNAAGNSAYTNTASATTLVRPTPPTGLSATAISAIQINLAWTDTSNNETGFKIERSTDNVTFVQLPLKGANATTHTSAGLLPGTLYYYRIRAYNEGGNSAYSNTASATTLVLPATPTGLTATAISGTQINLAWTDTSNNETGFKIERSTDNVTFVQLPAIGQNATSHSSVGLLPGTLYYYRIRAYNAGGNSAYSNTASATTLPLPAPPTNLTATAVSGTRINLTWTDRSNNETGFRIERSTDGVTFVQIASTGANVATYSNTGLTSGTLYYYRVRAYSAAGNSSYSNAASARP